MVNELWIAQVAHEINRAYCQSLGDDSQPEWDQAPQWKRDSSLAGVRMHLENPEATPEQSHESWLAQKLADGWTYGPEKDDEKKEHPCCVPYDQLPPEQKSKDYLFRAVVHMLKAAPVETVTKTVVKAAAAEELKPGQVAVQYIGRRPDYTDRIYGSMLTFVTNQVRNVPVELARKFLRHRDQFAEAELVASEGEDQSGDDTDQILAKAKQEKDKEHDEQSRIQDVRDQVMHMTKAALTEFVTVQYQQKLDQRKSVGDLRQEVIALIDRFSVV